MAGTFTTKQLSNGQLAATTGTLYTAPAATTTIIKTITLVNTDSSTRTVNVYLSTGTTRNLTPSNLSLGAGEAYIIDEVTTLSATNLISGAASVANVIDYTISGIEES